MSRRKIQKDKINVSDDGAITRRLVEAAQARVGSARGWQSRFAALLEIPPGQAHPYLVGQKIPGRKFQDRLRTAGFDVERIMVALNTEGAVTEPKGEYAVCVNSAEKEEIVKLVTDIMELLKKLKEKLDSMD